MLRRGLPSLFSALLVASLGVVACSKEQPAKPAAPAPAAPKVEETVKELPPDNDIPLPPPEEVDAGAPAAQPGVAKPSVAPANDICTPKACNGQLTEDLAAALGGKCRVARRCYESELANNPDLKGRISFKVRVAHDGTLCSARVDNDEVGNARLAACVASQFRGHVPSPTGNGCLETVVPCNFVRGGR
jgi:hypothetical protein